MGMKNVIAGDTLLWERREKNVVFMLSEFIDNSKSSYEEILKAGESIDELPIALSFNQKRGFISVEDKGTGFDIKKSIEKIGRDEVKVGDTNQYFVGMKSALNYFGDYSILISERKIDGENHRFCNFFIFKEGYNEFDIELNPTGQTGSLIVMFKNFATAREYWNTSLSFMNDSDRELFPAVESANVTSFTNTDNLLGDLKNQFGYISASLFQRYSPLVNKFRDIVIRFNCIDYQGENLLLDNSNGLTSYDGQRPVWLKEIKKNDFNFLASLNFDEFKLKNKSFYKKLEDDANFRNDFESFFADAIYRDYRTYFTKLANSQGLTEVSQVGKNFKLINNPIDKLEKHTSLEKMNAYPFAKIFADTFVSMLFLGKGSFSDFEFVMENMTINRQHIIEVNTFGEGEEMPNIFNIKFNWNLLSDAFHNQNYLAKYGKYDVDKFTGFELVQNNRGIYNGPNFDTINFAGQPYPTNILVDPLRENKFPNSWTVQSGTKAEEGGNVNSYTASIFGSIELSNDNNFTSGTNKSQIANLNIFTSYLQELVAESGLPVLAKWTNLLKNRFDTKDLTDQSELETKKKYWRENQSANPKTIIDAYIHHLVMDEIQNSSVINKGGDFNPNVLEDKINSLSSSEKKALDAVVESRIKEELKSDDDDTPVDNLANAVKHVDNKIKELKRNDVVAKSVGSSVSDTESYMVAINTRGKAGRALSNWKKTIIIKLNEDPEQLVNYSIEDDEPISIEFPVAFKKYDDAVLRSKIDTFVDNVVSMIDNIGGFYDIAKKSMKMNDNKIEEAVEAYIDVQLSKVDKLFDREDDNENL